MDIKPFKTYWTKQSSDFLSKRKNFLKDALKFKRNVSVSIRDRFLV